mmetsp:Transcript_14405/g.39572  ORF Transcript_14405/g.39572 Transcript_14405/m.39572 type:complete len:264 (-) Transcript_14405:414-1205(-)
MRVKMQSCRNLSSFSRKKLVRGNKLPRVGPLLLAWTAIGHVRIVQTSTSQSAMLATDVRCPSPTKCSSSSRSKAAEALAELLPQVSMGIGDALFARTSTLACAPLATAARHPSRRMRCWLRSTWNLHTRAAERKVELQLRGLTGIGHALCARTSTSRCAPRAIGARHRSRKMNPHWTSSPTFLKHRLSMLPRRKAAKALLWQVSMEIGRARIAQMSTSPSETRATAARCRSHRSISSNTPAVPLAVHRWQGSMEIGLACSARM